MLPVSVWIGFDPRESAAFAVARESARRRMSVHIPIRGLVLDRLRERGLYTRPTEMRLGSWQGNDGKKWSSSEPVLWDVISQAPMSTEFAITRFLVPHLVKEHNAGRSHGWALFMDCDVLIRGNLTKLVELCHKGDVQQYAVMVVKHTYQPKSETKMDGQVQTSYGRKNWSSVMFFNVDHPANRELTPELVNTVPGRDLHRFCWLDDTEIGELGVEWNYLVGEYNGECKDPVIVHFTNGGPWMRGFENVPYAEEWRSRRDDWAEL